MALLCKSPRGKRDAAFTLIEMLVVMAIISVLISLLTPAVNTMLRGSQLSRATDMLSAQLDLARQAALARNRSVEVRFYQYADPAASGERSGDPTTGKYRALQFFEVTETGGFKAMGKLQLLPPSVIMDSGSTLSSLFGNASATGVAPAKTSGAGLNATIPPAALQYNAVVFRFLPDGSTNLPPVSTSGWFLTLHGATDGDGRTAPPSNFATIRLDPANGHLRLYRP